MNLNDGVTVWRRFAWRGVILSEADLLCPNLNWYYVKLSNALLNGANLLEKGAVPNFVNKGLLPRAQE